MTKVTVIQMVSGADLQANLAVAARQLDDAARAGAGVAVLPENFAFMGANDAARVAMAETHGDAAAPMQAFLHERSRRLKLWLVGGTVPLLTAEPGRVASACMVFDARGDEVARYDKVHLFDVDVPGSAEQYRESTSTVAGSTPVVVDTPAGRLGLAVCYDLRFPELFRALSAAGAEVIALPAAFTLPTGKAHWEVLIRARAIENLSFVVAAAQGGQHASGRSTWGHSMIVDPWGTVLECLPTGPGQVTADLDRQAQLETRTRFPALAHRVFRVQ